MNFDILQGIREIIHGLGERRPRVDSVKLIQSILVKQMVLFISKTLQVALEFKHRKVSMTHVIYVLQNHKYTLIRILTYYLMKENIYKISVASEVEGNEVYGDNVINKSTLSVDKDLVEAVLNFNKKNEIMELNPINVFTSTYFKTKFVSKGRGKRKSVYKMIVNAIVALKLDINITNEDLRIATEARKLRVNELSIALSSHGYEGFQLCRRKNFHNTKIGIALFEEVNRALPSNIHYSKDIKEIFMFLAKETIACLFDHICENRKLKNSSPFLDTMPTNPESKKNKFESIRVDEITAVTSSIWDQSLENIQIPFKINNKLLNNKLILD
ncbi:Transcription initiation factor IID, subunit 13 [Cinara cedri]|uniref:Transcription initiation factor IID, subunit 13 n=1 Tax=Cinara cedri TaxID=506608 RepID=A0A5E4N9I9_9HEMI|nr:Transcription initiation factor IID, subunit 13 [Cinara cedri]